jgi:pimeloyl-ACP methyl ester carboxylesterase
VRNGWRSRAPQAKLRGVEREPEFVQRLFPHPVRRLGVPGGELAYVDVGEGRPVLLLHGNPTWSFLYRKVIDALSGAGVRLIAPDLLGFGRSTKIPAREHSLARHAEAIRALVEKLELQGVVLAVQDWGGPIGVLAASQLPGRIAALLIMNTSVIAPEQFRATRFHRFARLPLLSELAFYGARFPMTVLDRVQADRSSISGEVKRAYAWPLRPFLARGAPLALARMVPDSPEHASNAGLRAGDAFVRAFRGPVELVWGVRDPILGRALKKHRELLPEARVTELPAGHFLQEEAPVPIAEAIRRLAKAADVA